MTSVFNKVPLEFEKTHAFDSLPVDYISRKKHLEKLYGFFPSMDELKAHTKSRNQTPELRQMLVQVLREQYAESGITADGLLAENLDALSRHGTYTVTTGHQLNLFTGPLYFIYKILTTVKLAAMLRAEGINVVPVYWMATEDHDMEEIRHASIFGQKFEWETSWNGAAGKAGTEGISDVVEALQQKLGDMLGSDGLIDMISAAYKGSASLADATRKLVHELFGSTGLIILDSADDRLKREFLPVILDDLQHHSAERFVTATIQQLETNYRAQVHPRTINLFYLTQDKRERIVREGDVFHLATIGKKWTLSEILEEARNFPGRFSPNVVLRPLYQEILLPNLAMIGGPSEIAYWLEYKSMFDHFNVPFPALVLRSCMLLVDAASRDRLIKFGLTEDLIFESSDEWIKHYLKSNPELSFSIEDHLQLMEQEFNSLSEEVSRIDVTLKGSVEAEKQKVRNALKSIEEKVLRARKKKNENEVGQLVKLKEKLFPGGGLQERTENFIPFYLRYGDAFFNELLHHINPFEQKFLILTEKPAQG